MGLYPPSKPLPGPLASTSVNSKGKIPARSWEEAKVFLEGTGVYIPPWEGLSFSGKASSILRIHEDGTFQLLRQGDWDVALLEKFFPKGGKPLA